MGNKQNMAESWEDRTQFEVGWGSWNMKNWILEVTGISRERPWNS